MFESLRSQVAAAERRGVSGVSLASEVCALMDGAQAASAHVVAWRLAWVVTVYAPAYDPLLVATLPFCLEGIVEGYGTLDDLFEHIESAEPLEEAPDLPRDLPRRSAGRLAREVRTAVAGLQSDAGVLERIIDRIGRDATEREAHQPVRGEATSERASADAQLGVVRRLPAALREAVISVLQVQPAPRVVPLVQEIAGCLDAPSIRRFAGELVHVSHDENSLQVRLRATASLLAIQRQGLLDSL